MFLTQDQITNLASKKQCFYLLHSSLSYLSYVCYIACMIRPQIKSQVNLLWVIIYDVTLHHIALHWRQSEWLPAAPYPTIITENIIVLLYYTVLWYQWCPVQSTVLYRTVSLIWFQVWMQFDLKNQQNEHVNHSEWCVSKSLRFALNSCFALLIWNCLPFEV